MCNCYAESEQSVRAHVAEKLPQGAVNLNVHLGGYVFGIGDNEVSHRAALPVEIGYDAPKKAGGMKRVKQTINLRATFCPFCGVKY